MPTVLRTVRTALLSILAVASVSRAAEPSAQTRVTIRGSGSNVTIERAPAPALAIQKRVAASGALAEAVRLKTAGFDDATVVDYLRVHRVDLPAVINLEDVRRLRVAGAGDSVISYLSTLAALDIGATGEGAAPVVASTAPQGEAAYDGAPYGYYVDGGGYYYGGGYVGAPYSGHFGHRGFFPARRFGFHPGRPIPHPFTKPVGMPMPRPHPMPGPPSHRQRM